MEKKWHVAGLILIILGIILGAFGAHALKDALNDKEALNTFEVGVRYQLLTGILFLIAPIIFNHYAFRDKLVFRLVLIGVTLFSGSIYALTLRHLIGLDAIRFIAGPLTPLGGLCMIVGWFFLLFHIIIRPKPTEE